MQPEQLRGLLAVALLRRLMREHRGQAGRQQHEGVDGADPRVRVRAASAQSVGRGGA